MTILFVVLVFAVTVSKAQENPVTLDFNNAKNASETLKKYVKVLQNAGKAQVTTATLVFNNAKTASETLKKYVKALQNGNADGVAALMSKDAMVYGLGGGLDSLNATQHKAYWTNSFANYNHNISNDLYLPIKVENNWNEGEWLLTWGVNTLTNIKTGKVTPVPYHIASLVVDDKITAMHYYLDYISLLTKQGYKLTPPAE